MLPGDVMLTHSPGPIGWAIRLGERMRSPFGARWNHAGIVTSASGDTIEAWTRGVVRSVVSHHPERIILPCPAGVDRNRVVAAAVECLGERYNFMDILALAVDCLFGTSLHDSDRGQVICSELVTQCLVAGGWHSPKEPAALMMPSDLARALR